MMNLLNKISSLNKSPRKWVAVVVSVTLALLLTLLGIYYFQDYGVAIFILIPLLIGSTSVYLFGRNNTISAKEANAVGFLSLLIFVFGLLFFAIEGLICILMAAPISAIICLLAINFTHAYTGKSPKGVSYSIVILVLSTPLVSFVEKDMLPEVVPITTSVVIDASPQSVWKNVVEFPQLEEPSEFLFHTGVAYPINATIEGKGVGAIRYCNFTTGAFVEPITVWNENKLLAFDVKEQPIPMKELNFWDIDAPHLHDYFVSKKGQFKITVLANGRTLLEGTTWYYNKIKPNAYWNIWSDYIIHKIHERVLKHIKRNAENENHQ
jgi:hypothetical protein